MKWVRGRAGSKTQQWLEKVLGPSAATLPVRDVAVDMGVKEGDSTVKCWIVLKDKMSGDDRYMLAVSLVEANDCELEQAENSIIGLPVDDCQEVPACSRCAMGPVYDEDLGICWLCHVDDVVMV